MRELNRKFLNFLTISWFSLLLIPARALAQGYHGSWLSHPGMTMGWGMGIFGMIFMLIFWGLIITGLVFLIKWLFSLGNKTAEKNNSNSRALEILKERYARGEIDKNEFDARKQDLTT